VPIEEVTGVVLRKYGAKSTFDELEYEDGYRLRDAGIGDESALRFVTGTYLTASLQGLAPASRVADRLECSLPTAGRWIAAAKDAGFLTVADTRRR
jgi:hypothetical protein